MASNNQGYTQGRYRCPLLTQSDYPAWSSAIQVQMTAERCWKIISGELSMPDEPIYNTATSRAAQMENRQLHRDYEADVESYEQKTGMAAAIIRSSLTPAAESFVKGMLDPTTMWATLKEKLAPLGNPAIQQTIRSEFDALTFDGKEEITVYLERLPDYQNNLKSSPLANSDGGLVSKLLASLPATWKSQIRHLTDAGNPTLATVEKSLRNIQAEQTGTGSSSASASRAFAVTKPSGRRGRGRGGGGGRGKGRGTSGGGPATSGGATATATTTEIQCWYCARKGHKQDECHFKKQVEGLRKSRDEKRGRREGEKKGESPAGGSGQASENLAITTASSAVIEELPDDYPVDS